MAGIPTHRHRQRTSRQTNDSRPSRPAAGLARESAAFLILSVTLGGFPALASGQVLQGVLFGVAATDTLTMTGSILVLTAVALLATAIPVRRAVRVDPMVALRSD